MSSINFDLLHFEEFIIFGWYLRHACHGSCVPCNYIPDRSFTLPSPPRDNCSPAPELSLEKNAKTLELEPLETERSWVKAVKDTIIHLTCTRWPLASPSEMSKTGLTHLWWDFHEVHHEAKGSGNVWKVSLYQNVFKERSAEIVVAWPKMDGQWWCCCWWWWIRWIVCGDGTLVMDGDTYKCILMDICRYNMM